MSTKVKPKPWLEYLLDCISGDADTALSNVGDKFREARTNFQGGRMSEVELRTSLTEISNDVIANCKAKHHVEKLLNATIEFIVDPEKKL